MSYTEKSLFFTKSKRNRNIARRKGPEWFNDKPGGTVIEYPVDFQELIYVNKKMDHAFIYLSDKIIEERRSNLGIFTLTLR